MRTCAYTSWVGAYHDAELPAARQAELEQHLRQCADCTAELEELRRLTQMLSSEPAPFMPPSVPNRMHAHVDELLDSGLRRFAQILSGLAAAVLVMASIWLLRTTSVSADPLLPWVAVAESFSPDGSPQPQSLHAAEWIVTQLQPRRADDQD